MSGVLPRVGCALLTGQVQDLKAEDLNGLSDPVVYVEVRGEKQHTRVMKERVSCVFDDLFFFNLKALTLEEFDDTQIKAWAVTRWGPITECAAHVCCVCVTCVRVLGCVGVWMARRCPFLTPTHSLQTTSSGTSSLICRMCTSSRITRCFDRCVYGVVLRGAATAVVTVTCRRGCG